MIGTDALSKRYDGRSVLRDVSFRCEPGTVTGFLGPNGAGKTTTLRTLCGLSEPDTGRATVLGGPYRDLPNPAHRVGVLLDASAQHPGRRGREVLAVSAQTIGVPERRVDDCSPSWGSTARPPASACASTRWACASGWASRTPCSAIRRC
jgi:ABC-2 type transport system ATP-binding protein